MRIMSQFRERKMSTGPDPNDKFLMCLFRDVKRKAGKLVNHLTMIQYNLNILCQDLNNFI